ncbi:hypothetical protein DEFDS_P091 (plasmid) [Deferribacter desulfuricans SSM1]|uniref:Uncharacterized protein n=1 Tax=Deferribacter desulfuricans (strain DSM 14783 / JCM 11476 / NBRC 101012 / SSM1) TaxID=639282 RepID=D3PES2_DEFDS|nr:hypothetical protein [Deferribacter desulfuricans]BAI81714.1 hypothetical protein DEFDS_P091 [Deferribacter desulfuricans SSM1]
MIKRYKVYSNFNNNYKIIEVDTNKLQQLLESYSLDEIVNAVGLGIEGFKTRLVINPETYSIDPIRVPYNNGTQVVYPYTKHLFTVISFKDKYKTSNIVLEKELSKYWFSLFNNFPEFTQFIFNNYSQYFSNVPEKEKLKEIIQNLPGTIKSKIIDFILTEYLYTDIQNRLNRLSVNDIINHLNINCKPITENTQNVSYYDITL